MELRILTGATATNGQPTTAAQGSPLRGSLAAPGAAHMPNRNSDDVVVLVKSTAGSAVMTVTVRLWGYSPAAADWFPLGVGLAASPDASRGVLNDGAAIGEITADRIQHAEIVTGLSHFSRVYAEVTAIGGTSTAVDVWLVSAA